MKLDPHDKVLIDGELVEIGESIASAFAEGDRLLATSSTGLLLVPKAESELVRSCIDDALNAFSALSNVDESQISNFYLRFAQRLEDDKIFGVIRAAMMAMLQRQLLWVGRPRACCSVMQCAKT